MTHCVDSYLPDCLRGTSRLFHLHEVAQPRKRSTLELAFGAHGWHVRQHKGPVNSQISERLTLIGLETLRRARQPSST